MIHFMRPEEFLYQPMVLLDNRVMEYQFCMQNIQNSKGHYMEFGVFEGKSINYLASLNKKVTFHGFDSFDCDLYKSTQTILTLLNDQIVSGTLLRFDDLLPSHISPYPKWEEGEWKALSEWCLKFKRKVIPMARSWKQGCIMKVDV